MGRGSQKQTGGPSLLGPREKDTPPGLERSQLLNNQVPCKLISDREYSLVRGIHHCVLNIGWCRRSMEKDLGLLSSHQVL